METLAEHEEPDANASLTAWNSELLSGIEC